MEVIKISKENADDIIQYCEDLEKGIQGDKPCFSWKQLDIIKEILRG